MSMCASRRVRFLLDSLKTQQLDKIDQPTLLYRCQNSNFGSYLIAANLLRYQGAQLASNGRDVEFLFYDPDARGPDLLRRFNAGAAEPVNARVLYEVRGYLLSEVKRVQAGVGDDAQTVAD
jgi:hypothetical protein